MLRWLNRLLAFFVGRSTTARRPLVEEVEPRILYSADVNPLLWAGQDPHPTAIVGAVDSGSTDAAVQAVDAQQQRRREIVFVDAAVPDAQNIIDGLLAQRRAGADIEVVQLRADTDGLQQISDVLAQEQGLDAIHIISHGDKGRLQLGNATVDAAGLQSRAAQFRGWQAALTADADLLLYGCDVAQGAVGQAFVGELARLTGSDVAASVDLTGQSQLGGNWNLEYRSGQIESAVAVSAADQQAWAGLLAITTNSMSASSTTAATTALTWSHTVNAGSNRVLIVGLSIDNGSTATGVTYGGQAMTLVGRTVSAGNGTIELWSLVAPTVGTANIVATIGTAQKVVGGAASFDGVDQATPTSGGVTGTAGTGTAASHAIASASGDLAIGVLWGNDGVTATEGGGQTTKWSFVTGAGSSNPRGVGSTEAGAASVTMSWTLSASVQWVVGGTSIKAAVGNVAPTITNLSGDTMAYSAGNAATVIEQGANAAVADADSANFDTGALTVSFAAGGVSAQDVLSIRNQGTGAGQIGQSGSNVTYAGTTIGTWAGGSGGSDLVISLNANANATNTAALIQNIAYQNTDATTPTTGARTVRFVLADGDGGVSSNHDTTVNVGLRIAAVVTTTADTVDGNTSSIAALNANKGADGLISLREAIIAANNSAGADTIRFGIAGTGVHTINLASVLPTITDTVTIDATTDDSFAANGNRPAIVLNGANAIQDGLRLYSGSDGSTVRGLVIQRFTEDGIDIASSSGNTIVGNWVGLTSAGTAAAGNFNGINIFGGNNNVIGGLTAADRNIISGNAGPGVWLGGGGAGNQIRGNYIGTNVAGTAAVANASAGIDVYSGGNVIGGMAAGAGNVISGNTVYGVSFTGAAASGNTVAGNFIGLAATGTAMLGNGNDGVFIINGASNNTIGGTSVAARNVIAGNSDGVQIGGLSGGANSNVIQGNYIGTDVTGTLDFGNNDDGVDIDNAALNNQVIGNLISGNTSDGIDLGDAGASTGTVMQGNLIGTAANGSSALGNSGRGIFIGNGGTANNTLIGGTVSGQGNTVAFNALAGIYVPASTSVTMLGNTVFSNVGLGIDLGTSGITANDAGDADGGANGLQNFPLLTSANSNAAGTTIAGSLNSNANTTYRIEFFASRPTVADATNGEGERYLGFITVTTDGAGNASVNTTLASTWVNSGDRITATATVDLGGGNYGSTSEFAANVTASSTGIIVVDTTSVTVDGTTTSITNLGNARGADGRISLQEAVVAANNTANGGTPDKIVFAIPFTDANHVYYQNNGAIGTFSAPVATTLANAAISDFDTDYAAGTARSWYRISFGSSDLNVTQAVIIDGSTQAGYDATKGPIIEIVANAVSVGDPNAISLTTGASTIRGLVINGAGDNAIEADAGAGGSTIVGNYLGTDVSGTLARPNSTGGLWGAIAIKSNNVVVGGTTLADRNLISGNAGSGIEIYNSATGALIQGNTIGATVNGTVALGNAVAGIDIHSSAANNTVGGIAAGAGNLIAFNSGDGISITSTASGNAMRGNSIHSNAGLGIDLNNDGVTANDTNDTDAGPNALKNFPVLTAASTDGSSSVRISGTLNTTANATHTIDFYSSPSADASGYGEGATYLGSTVVTTDGAGNATFSNIAFAKVVPVGHVVSAVTIDLASGNTSEFSACVVATNAAPVLDSSKSPTLTAQNEDAGAPSGAVGTLVSALVDFASPAGQVDNVIDADSGALLGVAITAADTSNGSWWYSTDNGSSWNALGAVTNANARLLAADANTRLYFQANADYNGTLANAITLRGWDRISGSNGGTADTSSNGGSTAFSTATDTASLTVNAVNDAPLVATTGTTLAYTENAAATAVDSGLTVTDVDGGNLSSATITITAGFAGGQDTLAFTNQSGIVGSWNAGSGVLTLSGSATIAQYQTALRSISYVNSSDNPSTATRTVSTVVNDGSANSNTATRNISIAAVNDAPMISSNGGGPTAGVSVAENQTAVTTVTSTDVDGAAPVYSIVGGADAALFTINASTGALTFVATPNFEAPADAGGNNVYDVTVQVSDGSLTDTQAIAVTVTNVNEAPVITSNGAVATAAVSVAENQAAVTTVTSTDVDGAVPTYSISGGADAAMFTINASTGVLTFVTAPNFEAPADAGGNNVYDVTVQVSDGSLTDTQAIAVTVTNINEAPVISSNGGAATAGVNVAENQMAVTTVTSTDVDGGVPSYSINGGADAALFTINASTGALTFVTAPDFEAPTDAGGNNVYDVTVQVDDGNGGSDMQAIAVAVTNVNETPVITSNGGGAGVSVNVAENSTAVTTVTAVDVDLPAQTLTYSIVGGADAARFTLNPSTGALRFVTAPNFEAPTDAGADNVYDVLVRVSDGSATGTQAIAVTVTDVGEAPVITSNGGGATAAVSVADNTTAVTTVMASDADLPAQTLTYSIVAGADAAAFSIDANTGALSFVTAPSYAAPGDANGDNVYEVTVQASDGSAADSQAISVMINAPTNNPPLITSDGGGATAAIGAAENTTAVTTVMATDPESATQTLTFSIVGGADAARFAIDAATGVLSFITAPDFESPADTGADNTYNVTVQVSDGSLTDTQAIAVTVADINEAPVITSGGGAATASISLAENQATVATISATDVDGNTLTYTIAGGADSALFAIDSATGALTFITAPNFEAPADADGDNSYEVAVQVDDGSGGFDTQALAVTVSNVNEAPVITSGAAVNAAENQTAVTTVSSTDADGGAPSYNIVGGADQGSFAINAVTGVLSFVAAPNFESPADAGSDNVYDVTVRAADGNGGFDTRSIAVTVSNVNEAPIAVDDRLALSFDGVDDYVSIADSPSLVMTSAMTLEAWINPDVSSNATQLIANKEGEYELALFADGSLHFSFAEGGVWNWRATGVTIAPNAWTHVALTYDAGTVTTYVNGAAVNSQTLATTTIDDVYPAMNELRIGGRTNGAANSNFDGQIADVRVWNVVRSPAEIAGATNSTLTGAETGLAGCWALDENSGTTVADKTGNGNTGTLVNGPTWSGYRIGEDGTLSAALPSVLGNDHDTDGDALTTVLVSGPANGSLTLNADGSFTYTPTANWYGTDSFRYRANDGALDSNVATVTIVVDPVNDAPLISRNGGGASAPVSVAENQTAVTTVTSTDVDGGTAVYSIAGGADAARFTIDAGTGVLSFNTAPNYELTTDSDGDNVYELVVRVSDGALTDTQAIAVTVTNVNEAPVNGVPGAQTTPEDTPLVFSVANLNPISVDDTEAVFDPLQMTLTASNGTLTLAGTSGLTFTTGSGSGDATMTFTGTRADINAALDGLALLPAANFNGVASVQIATSDQGFSGSGGAQSDTDTVTVTVSAVNDEQLLSVNGGATVAEGSSGNIIGSAMLAATDVDNTAAQLAYTLNTAPANGTLRLSGAALAAGNSFTQADLDAGLVSYDHDGSQTTVDGFDFSVDDGAGAPSSGTFAWTIAPVNDAPLITSDGGGAAAALGVGENTAAVTTVIAGDADLPAQTLAYSIVGGADAALFTIDSATGALAFITAPNFESPTDAGGNNVYDVTVQVADGNGGVDTQAIAVTVINVNEAPRITSDGGGASATLSVAENQTAVTVVASADVDGAAPAYSIAGGADAARFAIDAASGALSFIAAPDFEAPADADTNNVYELVVSVADGNGGIDVQSIAVAVTGVNEAPGNIAPAAVSVSELARAGTVVAIVTASDPDAGDLFTFTLVNDGNGRFVVDPSSGRLTVAPAAVLDFEAEPSLTLLLRVTDAQGLRTEQQIVVTLRDVAEALPAVLPSSPPSPPAPAPVPVLVPVPAAELAPTPSAVPATPSIEPTPAIERETSDGRGASAAAASRGLVGAARHGLELQDAADSSSRRAHGRPLRDDALLLVASVSFTTDGAALGGWGDPMLDGMLMQPASGSMAPRFAGSALRGSSFVTDTDDDASAARRRSLDEALVAALQDPVRVASATLTAGFVWWLTRSGGLLTSILMGIPAWRHVDLLPVLAPARDDEDDADGNDDDTKVDERDSIVDEMFSNTSRQFGESRFLS